MDFLIDSIETRVSNQLVKKAEEHVASPSQLDAFRHCSCSKGWVNEFNYGWETYRPTLVLVVNIPLKIMIVGGRDVQGLQVVTFIFN